MECNHWLFNGKVYVVIPNDKNVYNCIMKILIFLFFYSAFVFLILLIDEDIESNPGHKTKTKNTNFFHAAVGMSIVY